MPASFSGKMFKTFLGLFFVLSVPTGLSAQENQGAPLSDFVDINYTAEMIEVDKNYENILDTYDTKRCVAYNSKNPTLCDVYEDAVQYIYKTDIIPSDNIYSKNIVQLSDNTFKIYGADTFYQEIDGSWKQIEFGIVEKGDFQAIQADKQIGLDEVISRLNPFHIYQVNAQNFYSGSGDGFCDTSGLGGTWATNHDANASPSGRCQYTGDSLTPRAYCYNTSWIIQRAYFPFDTSTLTDSGYQVSSSTVLMKQSGDGHDDDNDGDDFLTLVGVTPAVNNALTEQDFDQWGTTEYANRIDLTGKTDGTWWKFVLNSSGRSAVSFTSYTNFGLREGHDFLNSACSDGNYTGKYFYPAETTGTVSDPYMLVEVTEVEAICGDAECNGEETCETCETDCGSCPPSAGTTTLDELPALPFIDDLTVITGRTDHYESSTTAADWSELHYYRVPAILWWILGSTFLFILGFMLNQVQRILRKKK